MENKNTFVSHFTIIGSGVFLNLIIGMVTTLVITRVVEPNEYGLFSLFDMYESIAIMVLCMGLDQAYARFYYESEEASYKKTLHFKCVSIPLLTGGFFSIVAIILSITSCVQFEFSTLIVCFLCLYTLSDLVYRFNQLTLRLSYRSKTYTQINIFQKVTYSCLAIILILYTNLNTLAVLSFSILISFFVCMMTSFIAQRGIWHNAKMEDEQCQIHYRELLKYAYPYVFSMGLTTLFQSLDRLALNYYRTYAEVGIYSVAMSLVRIFAVLQISFNTLWAPAAIEHYVQDNEDRTLYQKVNGIITVVMFFVGLSIIVAKDLIVIVLGEKYREAAYIIPFLVFNPIMYTVSETTVNGLVFMKKSKYHILIALGACVTNAVGNVLLIPRYGCRGASISTGIAYIVFFGLRTFFSNRFFYVDYGIRRFFIVTIFSVSYALYCTFFITNVLTILGYFICVGVIMVLYRNTVMLIFKNIRGYIKR